MTAVVTIRPETDPRRKPRHTRDGAYCAPACGGGPIICSVERYENAKRVAERVCRDLGEGWIGVLTHNLGWYASAGSPCRRVWVSAHADLRRDPTGATIEGYTAFLGPPQEYGGSGKWAEHGKTPRKAIEAVLARAMSDLGLIQSVTDGLAGLVRKARRRPPTTRSPLLQLFIEIVDFQTDEVVKKLGPFPSERQREKADRGVNINLNHERFFTRDAKGKP